MSFFIILSFKIYCRLGIEFLILQNALPESFRIFLSLSQLNISQMVAILKKGENRKNMQKLLDKLSKKQEPKGIDVHKYCGTIRLKKDALAIQKDMRDEWD